MSPLLVLSSSICLINYVFFGIAIIKGRVKPHRTTRFIVVLIALFVTLSLFAQHNTVAIYLAGSYLLGNILIFLSSIKYGMGGWSKTDILCLFLSLFGICLWISTDNPVLALYAQIAADFIGMIPTFIKTYHFPHTEYWLFSAIDSFAAILNILDNKIFNFNAIIFPLYIITANTIIILFIYKSAYRRIFRYLGFHMF